jgi:hypothetical protein
MGLKTWPRYPLGFTPHLIWGGYDGGGGKTFCQYNGILFKRVGVVAGSSEKEVMKKHT